MPLGLGLGLGIGKCSTYPPASAWPTVADIPPGALVLDSDGVVKECRWTFHNAGGDTLQLNRPASLVSLLAPTNTYTVRTCISIAKTAAEAQQIVVFGSGALVGQQQLALSFYQGTINTALLRVGGAEKSGAFELPSVKTDLDIEIKSNGISTTLKINGGLICTLTNGTTLTGGGIFLCGASYAPAHNADADFHCYRFYDINGAIVDAFDPNRDDLWNGGATGYTVMGAPFAVSDGAPSGTRAKVLVPVSLMT